MKLDAPRGLAVLLFSLVVAGCSGSSQDALLQSARTALARNDDRTAVIQAKNVLQKNPESAEGRFLLGSALLDLGDAVGAEIELRKAQSLGVVPDRVVPKLAAALLAQGQYRKLTDAYAGTRLGAPGAVADLQTSLSYALAMQGQKAASEAALQSALSADPRFAPALIAQARFMAGNGDGPTALARIDEVVKRDPKNAEAWRLRGDIHTYLSEQPDVAMGDYRKALEANPSSASAHLAILAILMDQHKPDEAEKQLAQLRKVTGDNAQALYMEALIAYMRNDMTKTRTLAQQLLRVAPNSPPLLLLAGGAELQGGSLLQAQTYLEHAVQLSPDALTARRLLVTAYLQGNQPDRALAALVRRDDKSEIPPSLYALAGEVYLQNGEIRTAEDFFEKAARIDPSDAKARTSLALAHLVDGNPSQAFDELQTIAADDKGTSADLALITARLQRGEIDQARLAIDALERKQPGQPLASQLRGRILLSRKDEAGARREFEHAATLAPAYFPAVASLTQLDLAQGRVADARTRLEAFSARNPRSSQALVALATLPGTPDAVTVADLQHAIDAAPTQATPRILLVDFYLSRKDFQRATTVAQDALAAAPRQPEIVQAMGRAQQAAGDYNQAIATFGKLLELTPGSPAPYLHIADAQMLAGNHDAAATSLRKGLTIRPDFVDAQRKLALIDIGTGDYADALSIAHTVQKQRPKEATGFSMEGDIDSSRLDWSAAAGAYRQSLQRAPSSETAVRTHAALVAAGAGSEAGKFAADWRQAHPDDASFLFHLGDMAMFRQDYVVAETQYLAVLKLQPANAAAYNNLAWVVAQQNKAGALAYAEKANQLAPDQPAFMDTLATILVQEKQFDRAIALQAKAVELLPSNADFRLDLVKAYIKSGNKTEARKQLGQLVDLGARYPRQSEVADLMKNL